jgi:hypothetical protein
VPLAIIKVTPSTAAPGNAGNALAIRCVAFVVLFAAFVFTALSVSAQQSSSNLPIEGQPGIASILNLNAISNTTDTLPSPSQSKVVSRADSIRLKGKSVVDSIQQKLSKKMDSLRHVGGSVNSLPNALDSIKLPHSERVDSLANAITNKTDSLVQSVKKAEEKVNGGLSKLQQLGNVDQRLPEGISQLPGVPKLELPDAPTLPGMDLPAAKVPGLELPGLDPASSGLNLPQNLKVGELPTLDGQLPDVGKSVGELTSSTSEITSVAKNEMSSLDDIPGSIEEHLTQTEQLQSVQNEITQGNEALSLPAGVGGPDQLKQMAKKKVYTAAINHFAGKEKVLNDAIAKLDKLKARYPHLDSITNNLPRKARNAMHGKPLRERIVPRLDFQLQRTDVYLLDYFPNAAYRFTGRLLAGAGWNERIGIDNFRPSLNPRIYGVRTYVEFKAFKGLSARAEIERMNMAVPIPTGGPVVDTDPRAWVWSAFMGLKNSYQLYKGLRGNFQFMYKLYGYQAYSPYLQKFNVRVGFELSLKKKEKNRTQQQDQ